MFFSIDKVRQLVASGKTLILAGDEGALAALPRGNWIGGTIPYFMTAAGGKTSREGIYVEDVPPIAAGAQIAIYDEKTIAQIGVDSPENGYTVLILPAFTAIHSQYALAAATYKDIFLKAVAGWVSGIHLDDLGRKAPKVFNGKTGEVLPDRGVALHVTLPDTKRAQIGIVNIFDQGQGDRIQFPARGFEVRECRVNGVPQNFAQYFATSKLDPQLPLVADFNGALINVSIQQLDPAAGVARFYAPVFEDVTYRLAQPVDNYAARFAAAIPSDIVDPVFTCNCVLNYLYGNLEGRKTGAMVGPMTFGEIAYQLLNQTLVHVTISDA